MAPSKLDAAMEMRLTALADGTRSFTAIAAALGINHSTAAVWVARLGLPVATRSRTQARAAREAWGKPGYRAKQVRRLRRLGTKGSRAMDARLVALHGGTLHMPDIAAALGISLPTLRRWAKRLDLSFRLADRGLAPQPRPLPVPAWVPPALSEDYRAITRSQGEHAAARHCRQMKRAMEARAP